MSARMPSAYRVASVSVSSAGCRSAGGVSTKRRSFSTTIVVVEPTCHVRSPPCQMHACNPQLLDHNCGAHLLDLQLVRPDVALGPHVVVHHRHVLRCGGTVSE